MAGDWMKIELDLHDKPEVHYIASLLNLDTDAVVGKLFKVWSWFDRQTIDGNAQNVTLVTLDRLATHAGCGEAMQFAGWIEQKGKTLSMGHFDRHNGKSAKKRALTERRVQRSRNAASVTKALPEKRREDIKTLEKANGENHGCQHHNEDGSTCGQLATHKLHPQSKDWFCRSHLNG